MIAWIDAQLPPGLAQRLRETRGVDGRAQRVMGLRDAEAAVRFDPPRQSPGGDGAMIGKHGNFVESILQHRPPPRLSWVTCGNVSNARLQQVFASIFDDAVVLSHAGEAIVEITG